MKEKILVSHCLLGTPCRYDAASKPVANITDLKELYDLIPVCPEVEGGLPTPRLPCELIGEKVIRSDGADMTTPYKLGAEIALGLCQKYGCQIAILKEKSPSCGKKQTYDGTFSGTLKKGQGVTAKLLSENGITIYNENDFHHLMKK